MKRDMDLMRRIVLEVEDLPPGESLEGLDGVDPALFGEHAHLLYNDGFVEGADTSCDGGLSYILTRLTTRGHDFADSIRNDSVWTSVKEKAWTAGGWTLAILGELAKDELRQRLGLG